MSRDERSSYRSPNWLAYCSPGGQCQLPSLACWNRAGLRAARLRRSGSVLHSTQPAAWRRNTKKSAVVQHTQSPPVLRLVLQRQPWLGLIIEFQAIRIVLILEHRGEFVGGVSS